MREVLLIAAVVLVLVYGYFMMGRLDRFICGSRSAIEKENEQKEPSCMMLTQDLPPEEQLDEIRRFRDSHEHTVLLLFDASETELRELAARFAAGKR